MIITTSFIRIVTSLCAASVGGRTAAAARIVFSCSRRAAHVAGVFAGIAAAVFAAAVAISPRSAGISRTS